MQGGDIMDIGKLIRSRRIELGITQKDIAIHVGVSEGTVSRWESGNIGNMRRDRIAKLANILRISPTVVMGIEDIEKSEPTRCDLLEFLFNDNPDFLVKLKHIGMNGELDEPDIDARFSNKQKARLIDIISSTYHQAMQDAAIRAFGSDRPAGLSNDEWELIKQARLEKAITMSSVSCSGEKERA